MAEEITQNETSPPLLMLSSFNFIHVLCALSCVSYCEVSSPACGCAAGETMSFAPGTILADDSSLSSRSVMSPQGGGVSFCWFYISVMMRERLWCAALCPRQVHNSYTT